MNTIKTENIGKSYAGITALQGISLEIRSGELFGLIGPDGAGKTTLFRILTTLLLPDQGTASVCGVDVVRDYRQIRKRVGYMPGHFSLYQDLTVEENLNFFAAIFHTTVEENYEYVRDIYSRLEPFKKRSAGKLSGGMKQQLALSCALIHRPEVLFLDEPTTGVDPVSRVEFWEMLDGLKKQGITILVSTPYMDEAARCDRIALMEGGKCLSVDTSAGIRAGYQDILLAVRASEMYRLLLDLRAYPGVKTCYAFGDVHHIAISPVVDWTVFIRDMEKYLDKCGYSGVHIQRIEPDVEDCFMALGEN